MIHKRFLSLAVLSLLFAIPASASMVSFLIVETGLKEEAAYMPQTGLWEGGLMDAFFDAGHIVTNSPAARMQKRPAVDISGVVEEDYRDAVSGGADYFLLAFIEYQNHTERSIPVKITLKLYRTDSKRLIYEQNFPAGSGINNDEEYKIAQNAGRAVVPHLKDR